RVVVAVWGLSGLKEVVPLVHVIGDRQHANAEVADVAEVDDLGCVDRGGGGGRQVNRLAADDRREEKGQGAIGYGVAAQSHLDRVGVGVEGGGGLRVVGGQGRVIQAAIRGAELDVGVLQRQGANITGGVVAREALGIGGGVGRRGVDDGGLVGAGLG